MPGTTVEPVSQSSELDTEARQAVAGKAMHSDDNSASKKPLTSTIYIRTALDMVGYVVELPLRWKIMDLKPYLPVYTKIGYGLMLNAITDMWLLTSGVDRKDLDPNSITVVKHFIGYMNTMDDYLDSPENKHKQRPSLRFRKGDEMWERRKELFGSIVDYDIPKQKKLKRAICVSADSLMTAIVKFRGVSATGFDDALYIREETAGELCRVTAELFNVIHDVPPASAKAVEEAFWNVGMVLQVHDDVGDVCKDEQEGFGENLVLQLLNQRPAEKARLMEALARKKKCSYSKIVKYAPETAKAARDLQDHYFDVIPYTGGFERIRCLIDLTVSMRGRSAALRSIIDRMEL